MCVAPPRPFSISQTHSCNSCALAIAFGSDKQSKCCRTHQVLVITMKSKGNNNTPVLKVVTTKTLQPPKDTTPLTCVCLLSHGHVIIHSVSAEVALVTHQSNVPDLWQVSGWRRGLLETLLRLSCEWDVFPEKRLLQKWVWLAILIHESRSANFGYFVVMSCIKVWVGHSITMTEVQHLCPQW
jgi:hypothetical protein